MKSRTVLVQKLGSQITVRKRLGLGMVEGTVKSLGRNNRSKTSESLK